jgi:hypothetical protein
MARGWVNRCNRLRQFLAAFMSSLLVVVCDAARGTRATRSFSDDTSARTVHMSCPPGPGTRFVADLASEPAR